MDRIRSIYQILQSTQPIYGEFEQEWMINGLSSTPFKHLVSSALSTVTTSKRTVKACVALYAVVNNFDDIRKLSDEQLVELIKPVAHYNRKTQTLKKMCDIIVDRYDNRIPDTKEELLKLPGIGQKCANMMLNYKFNKPVIAVDTHIFRVVNRLGIVNASSHEKTAEILNDITPLEFKTHAHEWLIFLGMSVCKPRKPKCDECPVSPYCDFHHSKFV